MQCVLVKFIYALLPRRDRVGNPEGLGAQDRRHDVERSGNADWRKAGDPEFCEAFRQFGPRGQGKLGRAPDRRQDPVQDGVTLSVA